jgi:iron complex transport system substrate-binding protein
MPRTPALAVLVAAACLPLAACGSDDDVAYVDGGVQAWTRAAQPTTPQLLNTDQGFPFEQIAALKPDLIVGTNTYPLVADSADQLKGIAPTVAHVDAPGVDTWQQGPARRSPRG